MGSSLEAEVELSTAAPPLRALIDAFRTQSAHLAAAGGSRSTPGASNDAATFDALEELLIVSAVHVGGVGASPAAPQSSEVAESAEVGVPLPDGALSLCHSPFCIHFIFSFRRIFFLFAILDRLGGCAAHSRAPLVACQVRAVSCAQTAACGGRTTRGRRVRCRRC